MVVTDQLKMDKECRDLLKKEGRTPRKGKKPADAASNSAEKGINEQVDI